MKLVTLLSLIQFVTFVEPARIDTMNSSKAFLNLALRNPAWQVSTFFHVSLGISMSADLGVDGDATTDAHQKHCIHTEAGNSDTVWWVVYLQETRRVAMLTIYNRGDCCGHNNKDFIIGVGSDFTNPNFNPVNFQMCFQYNGAWTTGAIGRFNCKNGPLFGRYVAVYMLSATTALELCEIEVYSFTFESIAVGKPSYMNAVPYAAGHGHIYDAHYANDGLGAGNPNVAPHCTIGYQKDSPWWLVDLQEQRTTTRVVIQIRTDCCWTGFRNFTITVGNSFDPTNLLSLDPTIYTPCASVSGHLPPGGFLDVICDPPVKGRYLTVHLPEVLSGTGAIEICEIFIYDHPAFNLEETITILSTGSVYTPQVPYLLDNDDSTCFQVYEPKSNFDFLKIKIFNYQLCLNVSMISVQTENIPCRENGLLVYTPNVANQISACDFSGYFKKFDENKDNTYDGVKYDCRYIIHDDNIVTCDFVFLALLNVPNVSSKICGIDFK